MARTDLSRYEQAERIWRAMEQEARGRIWAGSFDKVAMRAAQIPCTNPRRQRVKMDLAAMECIRELEATAGRGSEYLLLYEPTLERYEQTGAELSKRERTKLFHKRKADDWFAVALTKTTQTRAEILEMLATKSVAELRALVIPSDDGTQVLRLPCLAYEDTEHNFPHLRCSQERPEHLEAERQKQTTVSTGGKT